MAEYGLEAAAQCPTGYQALPNWLDPWPNAFQTAVDISGYGGFGVDWPHLANLWRAGPLAMLFFGLGLLLKKAVLPRLAVVLGAPKNKAKMLRKFANQVWLFLFYTLSTAFGVYALHDKPWFGFPLGEENMAAMFLNFPTDPDNKMVWYYSIGLGFYSSEIASLFVETRRSDFVEYLVHHITTIVLIFMSFGGHDHPMGSWIILLHDASDIFLALAKSAHYVNYQTMVNVFFGVFIAGFVFFRLYCLPLNFITCFYVSPYYRKATLNFFALAHLLYAVLQVLHVYWFYLIVRMVFRLMRGVKGDDRSESDKDHDHPSNSSGTTRSGVKKPKKVSK